MDLGNDVSLRGIEAGQPASGVTLVLIPGWSTSADIWREQINRFAATYRVISFDPRSQGRSTITTTGNTPETRAQDLHTLLDDLSVLRPVLIGWSRESRTSPLTSINTGLAIFQALCWWMRPFQLEPRAWALAARHNQRRYLRRSPYTRRIRRNIWPT